MTKPLTRILSFLHPCRRSSCRARWAVVAAVILALGFGVSGCQTKIGGPLCPQVSIAAELGDLERQYSGLVDEAGKPVAPQLVQISLSGLHGNCRYNHLDYPTAVEFNTILHIDVSGVKAGAVGPIGFRYFIATVKSDQSIVERREFPVEIPLLTSDGVKLDPEVQTKLTLQKTELGTEAGSDYRLVYGLVMTERELKR